MGRGVQKRFLFSNSIWQNFFQPYTLCIDTRSGIGYPSPESHKDIGERYLEGLWDESVWPRWSELYHGDKDLHWPRGYCLFTAGSGSNSSELWLLEAVGKKQLLKLSH